MPTETAVIEPKVKTESKPQEPREESPKEKAKENPTESKLLEARRVKEEAKNNMSRAQEDYSSQYKVRGSLRSELMIEYHKIHFELTKLDKLPKVKQILSARKRKQLFERYTKIKDSVAKLDPKDIQDDLSRTEERESEKLLGSYQEFYNSIDENTELTNAVRQTIIDKKLAPQLQELVKKGKFSQEEVDQFLISFPSYLDSKNIEGKEAVELITKNISSYSYQTEKLIRNLLIKKDQRFLKIIAYYTATNDLAELKKTLPNAGMALDEVIKTFRKNSKPISDDFYESAFENDLDMWEGVRDSDAVKFFGETVNILDSNVYTYILRSSATDTEGKHIDQLSHYPTPDSVRNLVILAGGDNEGYRAVHANSALKRLSERKDWEEILKAAEDKYPLLKKVDSTLKNWDWTEHSPNPDLKELIVDFSVDLLNTPNQNEGLTLLLNSTLPQPVLIDRLVQEEKINPKDVSSIEKALALLPDDKKSSIEYYFRQTLLHRPIELGKLSVITDAIQDNLGNESAINFFTDWSVMARIQNGCDPEILSKLPKEAPFLFKVLGGDNAFKFNDILVYALDRKVLKTPEDIKSLDNLVKAFDQSISRDIIQNVLEFNKVSVDLAVKFTEKSIKLMENDPQMQDVRELIFDRGQELLKDESDIDLLNKFGETFGNNLTSHILRRVLLDKKMPIDLAMQFPKEAPLYMDPKFKFGKELIFEKADVLIKGPDDYKFLNRFAGEFGQKYDGVLKSYVESLESRVILRDEKELFLEFARKFRIISAETLKGYKEAKIGGYEDVYITQLTSLAEKLTGSEKITDEEREKAYYKDLIKHVYPNNSDNYGSYESNETCSDRSGDLAEFKIKPRYEIDLLSQSEIRVKGGETLDPKVKQDVQKHILDVSKKMESLGYDNEKIKAELSVEIDKNLQEILSKGEIEGISIDSVKSTEEKLFLILTDSIYGSGTVDKDAVKDLLITYEFANFEDIREYISGTTDRVSKASNQDYALLCEIDSFYSDRIKEVNRKIVQEAWRNPEIAKIMPEYFRKLASERVSSKRQEQINKLQVGRLGMSESFTKQLTKLLEKRRGRKYDPSEVREIVRRYESMTGGLQEKSSTSSKPETRAFYGQLKSQREKTFEALKILAGQEIDSRSVHLGEINLQEEENTEASIKSGNYNEDQFASYTVQRFIDLFEDERFQTENELDKYESLAGKQREILYGYISKSKETANARMVGGVCVSGDNPDKSQKNMWDMPNYMQLVLQDPDSKQCQGLVLMHTFTQDGKRVLTASLNPSSTYLYSVDPTALFKGLMGTLEKFAVDNNFDMITTSQNKTIRTNRTAGQFETEINKRVSEVGKSFRFDAPVQFSYRPVYQLQDMDVVWERPTAS